MKEDGASSFSLSYLTQFKKNRVDMMKQYIAIFNWRQADMFIQLGCPVISIRKNDKNMIKFIFEVTPEFEKAMERWRNGEFRKNMKG